MFRFTIFVIAAVVLLAVVPPLVVVGAPIKTLCSWPLPKSPPRSLHAAFASQYYRSKFPQFDWRFKFVGSPRTTVKNFVRSWVVNGTDCDMIVGPGYSFLSTGISPLVEVPWLDPSATSVELSDKENHPTFSRVIPTDEVGAKAAVSVMKSFGWKSTNILCADEPYGRSVAQGVSSAMAGIGGRVEVSRCLEQSASLDRVEDALQAFHSSGSRVIFVAMLRFQPIFQNFLEAASKTKAYNDFIFFMSEGMCSGSSRAYTQLHGSLCATYGASDALMQPFLAAYNARDTTQEKQLLAEMGYDMKEVEQWLTGKTDIFAAMAHDATHHLMSAITAHATGGGAGDIVEFLRNHTTQGATGNIQLMENGDRPEADLVVFQMQPTSEVKFATVQSGVMHYMSGFTENSLYFLGKQVTNNDVPNAEKPVAKTESANVGLIVGIVVPLTLLIAIAAAGVSRVLAPSARDNGMAPKGPEPFAIMFTDIQSSTALWSREPEAMSDGVERHHHKLRECIAKTRGYEVKTIGDSFMVAFNSARDCLECALMAQRELFAMDWGNQDAIDNTYQELMAENNLDVPDDYEKDWHGLRVRMGLHFGQGEPQLDPTTGGYDYYGTVVNTAARVEAASNGGQTCFTEDFFRALQESSKNQGGSLDAEFDSVTLSLGPTPLRGLNEPIGIYQILPNNLSARKFGPLRLDVDVEEDEDEDNDTSSKASSYSSKASMAQNKDMYYYTRMWVKNSTNDGYNHNPTLVYERMAEFEDFLKIVFSTSKSEVRRNVVVQLAQKWRLTVDERKIKRDNDESAYENALSGLTYKACKVLDTRKPLMVPPSLEMGKASSFKASFRRGSMRRGSMSTDKRPSVVSADKRASVSSDKYVDLGLPTLASPKNTPGEDGGKKVELPGAIPADEEKA